LKSPTRPADGVVLMDRAFVLNREDTIQILAACRHERGASFSAAGELLIELADVGFGEKSIGVSHIVDAGKPQFLGQTALPGLKVAFASAARLRRIGGIM
jgi:hypothetical protein